MRVHFHRFMYRVHDELKRLGEVENPLSKVADLFKKRRILSVSTSFCLGYYRCDDLGDFAARDV